MNGRAIGRRAAGVTAAVVFAMTAGGIAYGTTSTTSAPVHWVKTDASGNTTGKSDAGTTAYNNVAYAYFTIPNVDPSKCAITVEAANALFSDGPITTSYQIYGTWVYARAQQMHPNGAIDWYPKVGLDVTLAC